MPPNTCCHAAFMFDRASPWGKESMGYVDSRDPDQPTKLHHRCYTPIYSGVSNDFSVVSNDSADVQTDLIGCAGCSGPSLSVYSP